MTISVGFKAVSVVYRCVAHLIAVDVESAKLCVVGTGIFDFPLPTVAVVFGPPLIVNGLVSTGLKVLSVVGFAAAC
jgi:hypothetical protein